jgi:hypothetical protein
MMRIRTYIDPNAKHYVYTVSIKYANLPLQWSTYSFINNILVEGVDASNLELAGQNHLRAAKNLREKVHVS